MALASVSIPYLQHFWSLAVEEHFYLLWQLVVWAQSRRTLKWMCLAVAAATFLVRVIVVVCAPRPIIAFFLTPCCIDGLLIGSSVPLASRHPDEWVRLRRGTTLLLTVSGGLLLAIALYQQHFIPDTDPSRMPESATDGTLVITVGLAPLGVFFSCLVVLALEAARGSRFRRVLENDWLQIIGCSATRSKSFIR